MLYGCTPSNYPALDLPLPTPRPRAGGSEGGGGGTEGRRVEDGSGRGKGGPAGVRVIGEEREEGREREFREGRKRGKDGVRG